MNEGQVSISAKKGKQRKPGSGRTPGSYSFVLIKLKDLTGKFSDPEQPIQVGRKWAEMQGFTVATTSDAKHLFGAIQGTTEDTRIKAKVEEF